MKTTNMNIPAVLTMIALLSLSLSPAWAQGEMKHGKSGVMQGGSAPADARDPHAYSDGYDFGPIPRPRFADEQNFASLLVDRLEAVRNDDDTTAAYDLQAWYGRDYDRVVLKAEGDISNGKLEEADTELLWGHAIATFWDTQLGLRYESREEGPDRSWLAFGFQMSFDNSPLITIHELPNKGSPCDTYR